MLIFNLYREYEYLLESDKLTKIDKRKYKKILNEDMNLAELQNSINDLMYCLNKHYGKKVMLFIDEYDVPIQEAYIRGYYDDMIILIMNLLTSALKDNIYLEKAMITGILRVANESIFSGLNNLQINTILGLKFTDKFGFIEELEELLTYYNLQDKSDDIKKWYNGYVFGGKTIYNPWSVLNYIDSNEEGLRPYWINSSSDDLIKRLLLKGDNKKKQLWLH